MAITFDLGYKVMNKPFLRKGNYPAKLHDLTSKSWTSQVYIYFVCSRFSERQTIANCIRATINVNQSFPTIKPGNVFPSPDKSALTIFLQNRPVLFSFNLVWLVRQPSVIALISLDRELNQPSLSLNISLLATSSLSSFHLSKISLAWWLTVFCSTV